MPGLVLVIEDDDGIREAVGYHLEEGGYPVVLAADGNSGLEMAEASRPDLILLDLMVPGTNAAELLRQLRRVAGDTPILIMTAHDLGPADQASLGVDEGWLLRKPFSIQALLDAVASTCR